MSVPVVVAIGVLGGLGAIARFLPEAAPTPGGWDAGSPTARWS